MALITKYQIITTPTLSDLSKQVSLAIAQGWRPSGGICVSNAKVESDIEHQQFSQSMIK